MKTRVASRKDPVSVQKTPVGNGVFANRNFPVDAVIGEIKGEQYDLGRHGSDYCMDVGDDQVIEPLAPYRFLNHSCDPNCEYTWSSDETDENGTPVVYLIALRTIYVGEQLTIDYNWPAEYAIPCLCGSGVCRGWIVTIDEVDEVDLVNERDHAAVE